MNRIVLIGNGFDLAHGMKTSYNDFINYLWEDILMEVKASASLSVDNDLFKVSGYQGKQGELDKDFPARQKIEKLFKNRSFNNDFFRRIVERQYIDSWVDIEKEYYKNLIQIYTLNQANPSQDLSLELDLLNIEFEVIKKKLEDYLTAMDITYVLNDKKFELNKDLCHSIIQDKIYKSFNLRDFTEDFIKKEVESLYKSILQSYNEVKKKNIKFSELSEYERTIIEYCYPEFNEENLRKLLVKIPGPINFYNPIKQVLRLSFNYTKTSDLYNEAIISILNPNRIESLDPIHIHGSIHKKDNNPIIFGYGDELDDDYLEIEKLDDNRYLENIKSVKYLDRDNYKRLLEFVNSDQYQIVIMGHSCGNSDRTLLNTLFEHDNCVSIKPYYHKREDGSDNYSDIVRNITRNFNDKQKLRDRVVNKQYCEPLL